MRLAWASKSARRRSKRVSGNTDLLLRPFTGRAADRVSTVARGIEESDRTFVRIFIIALWVSAVKLQTPTTEALRHGDNTEKGKTLETPWNRGRGGKKGGQQKR